MLLHAIASNSKHSRRPLRELLRADGGKRPSRLTDGVDYPKNGCRSMRSAKEEVLVHGEGGRGRGRAMRGEGEAFATIGKNPEQLRGAGRRRPIAGSCHVGPRCGAKLSHLAYSKFVRRLRLAYLVLSSRAEGRGSGSLCAWDLIPKLLAKHPLPSVLPSSLSLSLDPLVRIELFRSCSLSRG